MSCIPQVSSIVHNRLYNFCFEGTEGPIKTSNNIADDQKHGRRHWRYLATQELASLYYPLLGLSYALLGSPVLLISDRKMSQLLINSPLLRSSKECLIAVIGSFMFDTFCSSMWLVNYFFLLTIHSLVCNKLNKEVQVMSETLRYVSFNCVKLQDFDGNELTLQITEQCSVSHIPPTHVQSISRKCRQLQLFMVLFNKLNSGTLWGTKVVYMAFAI